MQELVEAMLDRHHASAEGAGGGGDGAVLVFLPGAREIGSLQARLTGSTAAYSRVTY